MAIRQMGLTQEPIDEVGNQFWLIPPPVWNRLNEEFHFDGDACPFPRPPGYDGLKAEWGRMTWVNPPFVGPGSSRSAWARKMIMEHEKGRGSVLIIPMDRWVSRLLLAGAEIRVPTPFKWINPKGKQQASGRPTLLFILRPHPVETEAIPL